MSRKVKKNRHKDALKRRVIAQLEGKLRLGANGYWELFLPYHAWTDPRRRKPEVEQRWYVLPDMHVDRALFRGFIGDHGRAWNTDRLPF